MGDFYSEVERLRDGGETFAIATVIAVRGSASARPGSKAIINSNGRNVWGWVGGGCAETFVAENALEAMKEGQTRIVQADLDDEVFGLGMPCGGIMDVFIDPQQPPDPLPIAMPEGQEAVLSLIAKRCGFDPQVLPAPAILGAREREEAVRKLAEAIARHRGRDCGSLRKLKGVPIDGPAPRVEHPLPEFLIVGSSRITEELALLGTILGWPTRVYDWNSEVRNYPKGIALDEPDAGYLNFHVKAGSAVIIASHHKGDPEFMAKSLDGGAGYVGLIASEKRSRLVFEALAAGSYRQAPRDRAEQQRIFAPSGLDIACRNPTEIALSCVAEIIGLQG